MPTATVPLDAGSEKALKNLLSWGYASNKAAVIRKAIKQAEEEALINDILVSEHEITKGKVLTGDLKSLVDHVS